MPNDEWQTSSADLLRNAERMALSEDAIDDDVYWSAVKSLHGRDDPSVYTLCALASHQSAEVRQSVAFWLCGREDARSIETQIRLSDDVDPEARDWATCGLGAQTNVDSDVIRSALVKRLSDGDTSVRGEAIGGLALRHDERAGRAILQELEDPEGSDLALDAAAEMPRGEFVRALESLMERRPSEYVREALDRCRNAE